MSTHVYSSKYIRKINNINYQINLSIFDDYKSIEVLKRENRGLELELHFNVVKGHPKKNPYYYFRVLNEDVKVHFSDIEKYKDKSILLKYAEKVKNKGDRYFWWFVSGLEFKMQIINECRI